MRVEFLSSFKKDLRKISELKLKKKIKQVIINLEKVDTLKQVTNLKKMKAKSLNAYRIRIGDYRLGVYVNNDIIILARLVKRNDIYKVFP